MTNETQNFDKNSGLMHGKYGIELILDLHGCDASKFTRKSISKYFDRKLADKR